MAQQRSDFRFFDRLRVRWAEIDAQQIVFNAHYLMYFDTAVAGYWRALALPYAESMHRLGGDLYVKKASLEYHASARYDDMIDIGLRCARIGNSSMRFDGCVFRQDEPLVGCELVYVFADPATQTSRPVPPPLRSLIEGYEAGQPTFDVRVGNWSELGDAARAIRTEVFVKEQRIPAELEWDAADAEALHALASNRLGMPLATGRLLAAEPGIAKIGRMAVRQAVRGSAIGRAMLEALIDAARRRGDREVRLHAQRSAEGFYRRAGFAVYGQAFIEAGIPHLEMRRAL
jgi:YbgC/YbaW family acyl-CoA thioester hydrolase